jgi:hypothetical protein
LRLCLARFRLRRLGCKKIVLYLMRPEHAGALDLVPHDLSCYSIDDEYSFSEVEKPVDPDEARLIARVHQVFMCSEAMFRKKGSLNPHSCLVFNGVDFPAFSTPAPEPPDLAAVPHPRIGYIGVVKKQINIDLLARLAALHPTWHFVLVGPQAWKSCARFPPCTSSAPSPPARCRDTRSTWTSVCSATRWTATPSSFRRSSCRNTWRPGGRWWAPTSSRCAPSTT